MRSWFYDNPTLPRRRSLADPRRGTLGAGGANGWRSVGEFEDATIRVERNATDGDPEIVLTAKPLTDKGLARLTVLSPHWHKVVEAEAPHRTRACVNSCSRRRNRERGTAVPDAAQYIVEFENESADPEQSFSFVVGRDTTAFAVPGAIVVPASDYQIGVASVHENGNVVFVEKTFSTTD